jgi:hypothetical protein
MEMNTTVESHKGKFVIVQAKAHSADFTAQLGWTHFAEIKRENGRKAYFANLLVVDGEIVDTKVVM